MPTESEAAQEGDVVGASSREGPRKPPQEPRVAALSVSGSISPTTEPFWLGCTSGAARSRAILCGADYHLPHPGAAAGARAR